MKLIVLIDLFSVPRQLQPHHNAIPDNKYFADYADSAVRVTHWVNYY